MLREAAHGQFQIFGKLPQVEIMCYLSSLKKGKHFTKEMVGELFNLFCLCFFKGL